jgi:hypothetical protein
MRKERAFVLATIVSAVACSGAETEPKTAANGAPGAFTYAPFVDKPFHETMRRNEEVSIPGTPLRDGELWTMDWDVVTAKENNLYKRSMKLVGFKVAVNGMDLLHGDEIKAAKATIDILTDKDGNVADVRGTDDLSAAIAGLGSAEAQPALKRMFAPELLKALVVVRVRELHDDFIGHPAAAGSQWTLADANGHGTRQIKVVGEEACGERRCVRVSRQYEVDRQALYDNVSKHVGDYVKSQGADPASVKIAGMDLKLEDSLLIDPATMEYYGATFVENATLKVASEKGELPVSFKFERSSAFRY